MATRATRQLDRTFLALTLLVLGAAVLYPTVRMLAQAFGAWDLGVVLEPRGRTAVVNTLLIGLASVVFAGISGTALAVVLTRYSFPGGRTLGALAYLPFTLPPLVGMLSFYNLIGRDGIITRLLESTLGWEDAALPGLWAVLLIHTYSFYVFFYAMVGPALENLDRAQIEAARSLGAGRIRVFLRVTLPLLRPALLGASLLTFMSSGASFSAPYFFGRVNVLSVRIFEEKEQGDLQAALTLTVVLAVVSLLGVLIFRARTRPGGAASKGVRVPLRSRAGRMLAGGAAWCCMVLLLVPHAVILWFSFVDHRAWQTEIFPRMLTIGNYTALFQDPGAFAPIRNGLWMSGVAAAGCLAVGLPAAYLIARRRPGGQAVNWLVMIPWALPGTVIAINLIVSFNDPWMPRWTTLLPLAYFVRSVPLFTRMAGAAIEPFDATLIEAGRSLGASPGRCFLRIVMPLLAPAFCAALALVFATSLGEFVASILLYSPGYVPIAVQIGMEFRSSAGPAFAYSVLLMVLVGLTFAVSRRFTTRVM